jgi:hypothetical protein
MTVEAIKEAITGLSGEQRGSLLTWLQELEYDSWDKEMNHDFSEAGGGHHLLNELRLEFAAGNTESMEDGLAERGKTLK